jgi:hypothetical protein
MTDESIRSTVQKEAKTDSRQLKELISNYLVFTIASCLNKSTMIGVYEHLSTCYGYGNACLVHFSQILAASLIACDSKTLDRSFLSLYTPPDAQWLTPLLMNLSYSLVDWAIIVSLNIVATNSITWLRSDRWMFSSGHRNYILTLTKTTSKHGITT